MCWSDSNKWMLQSDNKVIWFMNAVALIINYLTIVGWPPDPSVGSALDIFIPSHSVPGLRNCGFQVQYYILKLQEHGEAPLWLCGRIWGAGAGMKVNRWILWVALAASSLC